METRNAVAEVAACKCRLLIDRTGEETFAQGAERNKANSQFLQRWQDLLLRFSPPQRILALQSSDRLNRMGAPDRPRSGFRHTKVLDLSFLNKILDRTGNVLDRNFEIDPVLIEEVDHLDLETLERCFGDFLDMRGAAVERVPLAAVSRIGFESELGRNHHLIPKRSQRFA